jgi:hypothetical protein
VDKTVVGVADEPIVDGQHLLISTHAWWMNTHHLLRDRRGVPEQLPYVSLVEHRLDCWVPTDPANDWLLDRRTTGRRIWLRGSEELARAAGLDTGHGGPVEGRFRAPYGLFYAECDGDPPVPRAGGWQQPDQQFFTGLPRTADQMLQRLQHDSPDRPWSGPFAYACDALRTGRVPAELRSVIYQALLLDDVELTGPTTDVDGRPCLALQHRTSRRISELLIDPDNGHFAGHRNTINDDSGPAPDGTVSGSSSVITRVVDHLGDIPHDLATLRRDGAPVLVD